MTIRVGEFSGTVSQSRDVKRAQLLPHSATGPMRGRGTVASDQTASVDLALAHIFLTMRATLGWNREQIAHRLGTTTATIELLEAGNTGALPPWSETLRVIETYGLVVGIDVGPVLDRLQKGAALPAPAVRQEPAALSRLELARTPATSASVSATPAWHPASAQAAKATGSPLPLRAAARKAAPLQPGSLPLAANNSQSVPQSRTVPASRAVPVAPMAGPRQAAPMVFAQRSGAESSAPPANDRVAAIAARLNQAADTQARSGASRRRRATVAAASIAVTIGAVGALLTALPSSTTSANPDKSFASTMRMSIERIVDGLRWIDVSDPKTRKADRLAPVK